MLELEHAARARSTGSTPSATATATASSSTCAARATASTTRTGRTPTTRWCSTTAPLARAPIAPVEVQGYVYDAKLRMAELARCVWRDDATAVRLEGEAATLRERFDAAFWLPERGWYALGLDADKRPVDALASNMGHLLWSGIVPAERVAEVAAKPRLGTALVRLGRPHPRRRRASVRPARVPQRHRLAARQLADCATASRGPAARAEAERVVRALLDCGALLRAPAAGAVRRRRAPTRRGAAGSCRRLRGRRRGRPEPRCCCSVRSWGSSRTRMPARCASPRTPSRLGRGLRARLRPRLRAALARTRGERHRLRRVVAGSRPLTPNGCPGRR